MIDAEIGLTVHAYYVQ